MSLSVIDRLDAEPEMQQVLNAVKSHPEERRFVVALLSKEPHDPFMQRGLVAFRGQAVVTPAIDNLPRKLGLASHLP
jgi:hypothetical protein